MFLNLGFVEAEQSFLSFQAKKGKLVLLEVVTSQQSLIKNSEGQKGGGTVNLSFMTSRKTVQAEIINSFRGCTDGSAERVPREKQGGEGAA